MAEDDFAQEALFAAIKRVDALPWPKIRHAALWDALKAIAYLLGLEIVKIEPPQAKETDKLNNPPA